MSISTERQTLADYVAIAISPALIVTLFGQRYVIRGLRI